MIKYFELAVDSKFEIKMNIWNNLKFIYIYKKKGGKELLSTKSIWDIEALSNKKIKSIKKIIF